MASSVLCVDGYLQQLHGLVRVCRSQSTLFRTVDVSNMAVLEAKQAAFCRLSGAFGQSRFPTYHSSNMNPKAACASRTPPVPAFSKQKTACLGFTEVPAPLCQASPGLYQATGFPALTAVGRVPQLLFSN